MDKATLGTSRVVVGLITGRAERFFVIEAWSAMKSLATKRALYLSMIPSNFLLIMNTHFHPTIF